MWLGDLFGACLNTGFITLPVVTMKAARLSQSFKLWCWPRQPSMKVDLWRFSPFHQGLHKAQDIKGHPGWISLLVIELLMNGLQSLKIKIWKGYINTSTERVLEWMRAATFQRIFVENGKRFDSTEACQWLSHHYISGFSQKLLSMKNMSKNQALIKPDIFNPSRAEMCHSYDYYTLNQ